MAGKFIWERSGQLPNAMTAMTTYLLQLFLSVRWCDLAIVDLNEGNADEKERTSRVHYTSALTKDDPSIGMYNTGWRFPGVVSVSSFSMHLPLKTMGPELSRSASVASVETL